MKLKYIDLTQFLKSNKLLNKGDYLYRHDKNEYPLKEEFDLSNLYFVTESNGHELTIHNMSNSNIEKIDLNSTSEIWWLLPLPDLIRKQIGLE
ncbi:hypothetical protein [Flavobacterium columnare]|uniref:Uncharacterized protein n=1 Tax=Flavobacterium columnare TaxID=996 RepID=A0AAI8CGJ0_9FLAO|nr:hypothetical protein [Flavobacterium columnare]AMO19762.1 hypothetical protein UN65_04840 [Flavobacterium columnare]AUX17693.1 hypothetical protein AQ623_04940 [Flavobacterium columnare]QOG56755.1 hypothetical protein HUE29_04895 [Flavobacterium columnare]QOG59480.1 hypothetical protein HUE30_04900 [Flavobacterium columnare]QOG62200.1 hypothetical protein HUE31_04900 [Flavobacterium columnare]